MTIIYRADGVKLRKFHHYFAGRTQYDVTHTTDYLDGFQYSIVENDPGLNHNNGLQFFPTAEGFYDFEIMNIFTSTNRQRRFADSIKKINIREAKTTLTSENKVQL